MLNFLYIPQADPNPLPLLDSPWPILLILSSYLIFVLKVGRIYMENRQPYKLKRVLRVYNLLQVLYNAICFGVTFYYIIIVGICDLHCMETFPQGHERKTLERSVHFAFIFNKILDLMDTVFFILRKSYKQVTFLHVYHHVFMVAGGYTLSRAFGTGGHLNMLGLLNSFVHIIMYFYYYLSAEYPGVKASIWWKKYITLTQIVQFVILFFYSFYVRVFSRPDCRVPHVMLYVNMMQGMIFFYLFTSFYFKTYLRPLKKKEN
ncbi:uncharacterized protein Dwil_GK20710 [Drosophila willistoni]|uniref:Elongation of very long chain fatty acids protein n=1 Tax=Drosophila willistoni TaxID=7260 RepID=B4MK03_DROWI|nr:elongation of very long chain fatty acids protein F isoform X1 [Drosophila willistoni]EDW72442.2 uncharacterized protein Dwil_GK20710 [Drosophila willistoni]